MSNRRLLGFEVSPLSQRAIAHEATALRGKLGDMSILSSDVKRVSMCQVLERMQDAQLLTLDIVFDGELNKIEADCLGTDIRIAESIYERAAEGCSRSNFTLAHELGHAILHCTEEPMSFAYSRNPVHAIYKDSEWQADTFASSFLAPYHLLDASITAAKIQAEFGLSLTASLVRMRSYRLERQRAARSDSLK